MDTDKKIFENGSTTYYWSSSFFPKKIRSDVFKLYSFVRVVDDIVDQKKPQIQDFEYVVRRWKVIKKKLSTPVKKIDDSVLEHVLSNIAFVVHRYDCDPAWVDAFLKSMRMDIEQRRYYKLADTEAYMYGSAEVIGLFMAKMMQLPEGSYDYARALGKSMQYVNFIRDIAEDNALGRCYFPAEELTMFGLKDLSKKEALKKPAEYREFMEYQLNRYDEWQAHASKGFIYIPKKLRTALRTATDMYSWTAAQIRENPSAVYEHKIKPTKRRILTRGLLRTFYG